MNCIKGKDDCFSSSFALVCVVQKYEKISDESYLTFEIPEKNIVKTIMIDKKTDNKISENNISDIIGIHVIMNIPQSEIDGLHIDTKDSNFEWRIFEDGLFDEYCEIVGVSFGEQ